MQRGGGISLAVKINIRNTLVSPFYTCADGITLENFFITYNLPVLISSVYFEPNLGTHLRIQTGINSIDVYFFYFTIGNYGSFECVINNKYTIYDLSTATLLQIPPPTEGDIVIYGGFQRFHNAETDEYSKFNSPYTDFPHFHLLPNDTVSFSPIAGFAIRNRIPQTICGLVESTSFSSNGSLRVQLKFINLPSGSLFDIDLSYLLQGKAINIGDRIVFLANRLETNYTFLGKDSSDAIADVPILTTLYAGTPPTVFASEWYSGRDLYTQHFLDRATGIPRNVMRERGLRTFTIDPASSQDFDDAISVDVRSGTVYVHIVDIANVELFPDEEERLRSRCFTLYMANEHTEHLLRPITASDTLSLNEGKPRFVVTVEMRKDGSYHIYRSVIVVDKRYNYEEVLAQLDDPSFAADIKYLDTLAIGKGTIALPSMRFTVDQTTGLLSEYSLESSTDRSHMLIAKAMIMANCKVAEHLFKNGIAIPNRFHKAPRGGKVPIITNNPVVDAFLVIKEFTTAVYDPTSAGHFGLGLSQYVHFTSPMRRYADVLIHKLLAGYVIPDLEERAIHITNREAISKNIEIMYKNLKLLRHLKTMPTKVYEAFVIKVSSGGVILFLPEVLLEKFVHVRTIQPLQTWIYNTSPDTFTGTVNPERVIKIGSGYSVTLFDITPEKGEFSILLNATNEIF